MDNSLPNLRERLSAPTRDYLDLKLTNPNGNYAALATVATGCIRAGLTEDEFKRVVESSDLGDALVRSKKFKTASQLHAMAGKAWAYSETNFDYGFFKDDRSIRQQLEDLLHRIRTGSWTGKSANSDRAVAAALVVKALEAGGKGYSVRASTRELSELSGVAFATVGEALGRLRSLGLIKSVQLNGRGRSRTWGLDLSWNRVLIGDSRTYELPIKDSYVQESPLTTLTHEVFIGKGSLGQASARIWDWVSSHAAATINEIRKGTGLGDQAVRTHVSNMVELGLLSREGVRNARYSMAETADLDAVAEQLGSVGWRDRARVRHDAERDAWNKQPMSSDISEEAVRELADINHWRILPWSIPDPFDHTDNRIPVYMPSRVPDVATDPFSNM